MSPYFILHPPSRQSWATADPHQWLLDRRDDDLLAPARERLLASPDDPERCLRVALRRCGLALIHVANEQRVLVRHWSGPAPDLRGWAKQNSSAKANVVVTFEALKNGTFFVHQDDGDTLLCGERTGPDFEWAVYEARYAKRRVHEVDDSDDAFASVTNFEWEKSLHERLTWRVLKASWNAEAVPCPNCDIPLMLVAFDWRMGMLSFRSGRVVRVCLRCRRRFEVAVQEPLAWLASVLPPPLRPSHLRLWAAVPIDWGGLSLGRGRVVQRAGRGG